MNVYNYTVCVLYLCKYMIDDDICFKTYTTYYLAI